MYHTVFEDFEVGIVHNSNRAWNVAPSDIMIEPTGSLGFSAVVKEHLPVGTTVGNFVVADEDSEDVHSLKVGFWVRWIG